MGLVARLQQAAAPLRERILAHPFVRGIGNGSLPVARYQYYLRQDYLFLIEYSRVLALAASRAPDLQVAARFADLLHLTLHVEMDLHRQVCWSAGISPEALEETRPAPTTWAYTRHLRLVAETEDLPAILASLLPCAYGYWEIAASLRARGLPEHQPLYADWIRLYTSEDYEAMARWLVDLLDRLASDVPPRREEVLRDLYLVSTRYEYLFWEMAYRMEEWPL